MQYSAGAETEGDGLGVRALHKEGKTLCASTAF